MQGTSRRPSSRYCRVLAGLPFAKVPSPELSLKPDGSASWPKSTRRRVSTTLWHRRTTTLTSQPPPCPYLWRLVADDFHCEIELKRARSARAYPIDHLAEAVFERYRRSIAEQGAGPVSRAICQLHLLGACGKMNGSQVEPEQVGDVLGKLIDRHEPIVRANIDDLAIAGGLIGHLFERRDDVRD